MKKLKTLCYYLAFCVILAGSGSLHSTAEALELAMLEAGFDIGASAEEEEEDSWVKALRELNVMRMKHWIAQGTDVNAPIEKEDLWFDEGGEFEEGETITPLVYLVQMESLDGVHELLEAGARPNDPSGFLQITALYALVEVPYDKDLKPMFDELLARGADVNAQDGDEETPLHRAAYDETPGWAELLIEHGANVLVVDDQGHIPLHHAASNEGDNSVAMVARLLTPPAGLHYTPEERESYIRGQVIVKDNLGMLPLHLAADNAAPNAWRSVVMLVSAGSPVNEANEVGATPLQLASSTSLEATRFLLEHGADATAENVDKHTALHYVSESDSFSRDIAQALINKGGDINARDALGRTPLYLAALALQPDNVDILLELGADRTIPDNDGQLPLPESLEAPDLPEDERGDQWDPIFATDYENYAAADQRISLETSPQYQYPVKHMLRYVLENYFDIEDEGEEHGRVKDPITKKPIIGRDLYKLLKLHPVPSSASDPPEFHELEGFDIEDEHSYAALALAGRMAQIFLTEQVSELQGAHAEFAQAETALEEAEAGGVEIEIDEKLEAVDFQRTWLEEKQEIYDETENLLEEIKADMRELREEYDLLDEEEALAAEFSGSEGDYSEVESDEGGSVLSLGTDEREASGAEFSGSESGYSEVGSDGSWLSQD